MKVPLQCTSAVRDNREFLLIWANRKGKAVKAPFEPYFYSLKNLTIPGAVVDEIEAIAISNYKKTTFYKYSFPTRKALVNNRSDSVFESNIPYILRHRIDDPDFFLKYPQTDDLTFNFLDIEQSCKKDKIFPNYSDYLLSIAWSGNDRDIKCAYLEKGMQNDVGLLETYIDHYSRPDVEVGYNKTYDLPTIMKRCDKNKLSTSWLSKTNREPKIIKRAPFIDGVVLYDVLDSVNSDQTLTGNVPDHKLESISDYFGFKGHPGLDLSDITSKQGTQDLISYNKEDAERLMHLFDIYWPGIQYLADDLKIPLSEAVNLNVFSLGLIVLGDLYKQNGIICDGDNSVRYPEIFNRPKKTGESNYQAAIIKIYKYGYFEPIRKVDFSGMYPRLVSEFNLSPDTCKLIRYDDYKDDGFKIVEKDNKFIYHIPDKILNKIVIVSVLKKPGFLADTLGKFLKERAGFKADYKKTDSLISRVKSWESKLKANGLLGVLGHAHHPFGHVIIIIVMCGLGRECEKLLIGVLERLYPGSTIEADTDGVYCNADNFDAELVQKEFKKAIIKKFGRVLGLEIDIDEYDAGWFYLAKNYVLKKGDTVIIHGGALKGSNKTPFDKKLTDELAFAVVNKQPIDDIAARYRGLMTERKVSLVDLTMKVTMGMHPKKYKSKTATVLQLARQAKKSFDVVPREGNTYYYIKVKSNYKVDVNQQGLGDDGVTYKYLLYESAVRDENIMQKIDFDYYEKRMNRIIDIFSGEMEAKRKPKKVKKEAKNGNRKRQMSLNISTLQGKADSFVDTFVKFDFPGKGKKLTKPEHFREWFRHLRTNWEEVINDILMERNKDKYDQDVWEGLLQSGLVKKDEDGEYRFVD